MITQAKWTELVEHFDHDYAALSGALRVMCNDKDADFLLTVQPVTKARVP